jgi:hypothetical protein
MRWRGFHQRRTAWVQSHLIEVLEWMGVEPVTDDATVWDIQPMIVVHRELVAPFLQPPEIPIVAFEAFRKKIADW